MNDPALAWLIAQPSTGLSVWLCDEHFYGAENFLPKGHDHFYVCNRYDIVQRMHGAGLNAVFSDFADADLPDTINTVYYRVSKEKPVVHRALNIAANKLTDGGRLHISGLKNEGAKNHLDKAATLLGCTKATQKIGLAYSASLVRQQTTHQVLDDSNYAQLRPIAKAPHLASKPGQFGWQKVDQGSEFLLQTLAEHGALAHTQSLLDLGCGYGFLALTACQQLLPTTPAKITLTDNNAAALLSADHNCQQLGINTEIIAADCGDQVKDRFDTLLCNPPFHQGFGISQDLTERFLKSAALHLQPDGHAWFVVNSFIPVEDKAKPYFAKQTTVANNKQFKVIHLSQPRVT